MRYLTFFAAAAAVFSVGAGAGATLYKYSRVEARSHIDTRQIAVMSQARQGNFPVVILGDSIVELADVPSLCGQRTLNAGYAGGQVATLVKFAPEVLAAVRPKLVVLAIGVNDAHTKGPTDRFAFAADYKSVIAMARASGAQVVAVDVAPVSDVNFPLSGVFDLDRIDDVNNAIHDSGVPVLKLAAGMTEPGKRTLPDNYSDDGVHPNAVGYRAWTKVVSGACSYLGI